MIETLSQLCKRSIFTIAMADPELNRVPVIDPEHRFAGCYRAALSLAETPISRDRGIGAMWALLDDTPCMIGVYFWLANQRHAQMNFEACYMDWCRAGYYGLLAATGYGISFGQIENVIDQILQNGDPEVFAAAAHTYVTNVDLAVRLLRLAIRSGRPDRVAWVADEYPQHHHQFADLALARGGKLRQGNALRKQNIVAIWKVLTDRYHLRFIGNQCLKIHDDLIEYSFLHGILGSDQVCYILATRAQDVQLWTKLLSLRSDPAITIALSNQQGVVREQVIRAFDGKDLDRIKLFMRWVLDVHAEQEALFATLLTRHMHRVTDSKKPLDRLQRESYIEIFLWFIGEYHIDLTARSGQFLLFHDVSLSDLFVAATASLPYRCYAGHRMRCVVSRYQLPFFNCEEYRIENLYMYSSCMIYRPVREAFAAGSSDGHQIDQISPHKWSDKHSWHHFKVNLIWSRDPGQVHTIYLPNFLKPIIERFPHKAPKSARSAEHQP